MNLVIIVTVSVIVGASIGSSVSYLIAKSRLHRFASREQDARKRAQAAEHLAEIGSMTGGLAHEIKNPLSTIGLNAQLLSESIEDLPIEEHDRSRLIRRIEALGRETERLRGILEDFLEYAGELRLNVQMVSVNTVIEELADFFSPMATGAGTRLRIETAPSNPIIPIDSNHIKQAMLNLMLNAVHAMEKNPEGSARELIVRVVQTEEGDLDSMIKIHIIDTGQGMDEETRAKVFHPYFTTKSGGTGLGLPTARRIIHAHQGQLDLHSELGKGSDFVISLPIRN